MNPKEKLYWSIAFPGFGQFLNGKFLKGIVLLTLEIIINNRSKFNEIIILSFHGKIEEAINRVDYQWLMFYPCIYFFSIWDAYRDAGGAKEPYSFLPFVFCAYFVTVGTIYSSSFSIFGIFPGPIWLPMICVIPGILSGNILKYILVKRQHKMM